MSADAEPASAPAAAATAAAAGGSSAEASSSKVTLDTLKQRRISARRAQLDALRRARDAELRELRFLLARRERYGVEGGPAIPPADDRWVLEGEKGGEEEQDEEHADHFLKEYALEG